MTVSKVHNVVNIVCVCRDNKGKITHVGAEALLATENHILWSVAEACEKIENGTRFSVINNHNRNVDIKPHYNSTTNNFEYLATYPDGESINNLTNLKDCNACKD